MKPSIWAFLLSAILFLPIASYGQGDPVAGLEHSFTCSGCHAVSGMRNAYPAYPVPKIAGQNADYLLAALKAYRDDVREHATMHAQTAQFTDEELADLAAYFATLPRE